MQIFPVRINLYSGMSADVSRACTVQYNQTPDALLIQPQSEPVRAWGELRLLLAQIRSRIGDLGFEAIVERNRPIASFLFSRILGDLTPTEKEERSLLAARLTSHLTHNWYIERPFYEGLAGLLGDMFIACGEPKIFIPLFNQISPGTFAALRSLMKRFPECRFSLTIGYSPHEVFSRVDESGIRWGNSQDLADRMLRSLCASASVAHLGACEQEEEPERLCSQGNQLALDPLDEDLEGRLHATQSSESSLVEWDFTRPIVNAFESFDRDAALALALGVVCRCKAIPRAKLALLHEIISLSAHGRQFDTISGDGRFNAFLAEHLECAFEYEEDPVVRVCLCYRLAVVEGRRRKNFEVAHRYAEQAMEQLPTLQIEAGLRDYLEAWSRNIRAYLQMSRGNIGLAFEDMECAFRKVDESRSDDPYMSRENRFMRVLLILNLETLCHITKNESRLRFWLQRLHQIEEESLELTGARLTASKRTIYFRKNMELGAAIETALHGLDDARREFQVRYEYNHLMNLGLLYYMQGKLDAAMPCFSEACNLAIHLGLEEGANHLELIAGVFFSVAGARCDDSQAAIKKFIELIDFHERSGAIHFVIELLGALAVCYGRAGREQESEAAVNRAIDLALVNASSELMVEICCSAGTALVLLGKKDEAASAFSKGMELASLGCEEDVASAWQVVRLCLGYAKCGHYEPWMLKALLRAMPEALDQSAESWWELPDLFMWLQERREDVTALQTEDPAFSISISKLEKALSQRFHPTLSD